MIVRARWLAPIRFDAATETGYTLAMDVPPTTNRRHTGPTPMEVVLSALTACTGMDVAGILLKMRAPLEGLVITAEGERAEEHPKVFTRIRLRYDAWGAALQKEQVCHAVELSLDKYCSVAAMLRQTAAITHEVIVAPSEAELTEALPVSAAYLRHKRHDRDFGPNRGRRSSSCSNSASLTSNRTRKTIA